MCVSIHRHTYLDLFLTLSLSLPLRTYTCTYLHSKAPLNLAPPLPNPLMQGSVGQVYNIGSRRERTVLEVAGDVLAAFRQPTSRAVHVRDRAFNDARYRIDDAKLAALGWEETTTWEDGLARTIAWYVGSGAERWDERRIEAALRPHPEP